MDATFGFVGIGHMGKPMVLRLLEAGRQVVVYDAHAVLDDVKEAGAQIVHSAAQVGDSASTVFLSLPNADVVLSVISGPNGLTGCSECRAVIDFSTIGPAASRQAAAALLACGINYVDAPVSGGTVGARKGTLAIMTACRRDLFYDLKEVLTVFGKPFHVGETHGQAQVMKLANNLLNVAAVALTSEAMVMGTKAGLDPAQMLEIINAGTGRNSATVDKFPAAVLSGTFSYGFSTGLSYKDVGLCVDEAEAMGVPMVVGSAVRQLLAITNSDYGPESDFTSVCRVVEGWAKVQVRSSGI